MAIFTKEFEDKLEHVAKVLHDEISDSFNTIIVHIIIVLCLILAIPVLLHFGTIGFNEWWMQYSITNPNVQITATTQYWAFKLSVMAIHIAVMFEIAYVLLVFGVIVVRPYFNKLCRCDTGYIDKQQPACPKCKETMAIIKNGTRNGSRRYFCKTCGKYFMKRGE